MKSEKQYFRILFLLSVLLLLLNDFFLKAYYHNGFTGKLSDFAGLFALPYFLCILFPKRTKFNYITAGLLFIIWKSEMIEPILNYMQSMGIGMNRTIDYSDLSALLILPFSYAYWHSKSYHLVDVNVNFKPIVIGICSFAFIATSLPRAKGDIKLKSNLEIKLKAKKSDVVSKLELSEISKNKYHCTIKLPEQNSKITSSIILNQLDNGIINIKLDSILESETKGGLFFGSMDDELEFIEKLQVEDYEKLYLEEIAKLYTK